LLQAISPELARFDPVFDEIKSSSWSSATFNGARHELCLHLRGEGAVAAAEHFSANLDPRRFNLRGHILADIAVVGMERTDAGTKLRLQALTVEDS
jgi:hypothetical protein